MIEFFQVSGKEGGYTSLSRKKFLLRKVFKFLEKEAKKYSWEDEEDISHDPGGGCFNNCDSCRACGSRQ